MKEAPFFIGQRVIANRTVTNGFGVGITKDRAYSVVGLYQTPCCGYWMVDVGLISGIGNTFCECRTRLPIKTKTVWASHCLFDEENEYKDVTKELAVLPTDEVPDVKKIKELVN